MYYDQRVPIYGFSSVSFLCVFVYYVWHTQNDVFLYVVPKWFNLVQVTDGWSEGGVLVGKTHTS